MKLSLQFDVCGNTEIPTDVRNQDDFYYLGKYAYSIYLIHPLVLELLVAYDNQFEALERLMSLPIGEIHKIDL